MKTLFIISRSVILTIKTVLRKVVENITARIVHSVTFFSEDLAVYENVEKYRRAEQATDDNTARSHCMLDT